MRVSTSYIHYQGVQNMLQQQAKLVDVQNQLSKGVKNLAPSDDPSAASRILNLDESISQMTQYEENAGYATQRLSLEESTLDSVNNLLIRVKELAIQAGNTGTYGGDEERIIAAELRERLQELMDYANTKDASGEYLFAGFQSGTKPFTTDGNDNYFYNGDQGQMALQIGASRQVIANDSGAEVFQMIRAGNGDFTVDANSTNGGTAKISTGSVITRSAFQAHDFSIVFDEVVPATIPSTHTYSVYDDTLGTGIPVVSAQPYADGGVVAFNGIAVEISGDPVDGDIFTVQASRNQDVFTTISNLINSMEAPSTGNVRGIIGGDFINNGFDNVAGETVSFDIDFDAVSLSPVSVVVGVGDTNTTIAQTMLDAIGTAAAVAANADGSYTVPGTTPGVDVTFRRVGDNVEFITRGGTTSSLNSVQISNLADTALSDAVLDITGSGNSVTTQATLDASVVGDTATYLAGTPHVSYLTQQIDNAMNNLDQSMDSIIHVQTSIGGRLNSIDSQLEDNADRKIQLETIRSDIRDLDFSEAISNFNFQTTALQAAQQTFVQIQNLNLFNYI